LTILVMNLLTKMTINQAINIHISLVRYWLVKMFLLLISSSKKRKKSLPVKAMKLKKTIPKTSLGDQVLLKSIWLMIPTLSMKMKIKIIHIIQQIPLLNQIRKALKIINDEKTNENKDSNLENIIPDINENLKGEVKKDHDEKDDENIANENNPSKSSLHEEKKKVYNTLDYLFNFLSNKGQLNFVLCGYFQKVFNHLANYKNAYVNNSLIN
jgi:hypothetical protein